jgi:hypothetical protein
LRHRHKRYRILLIYVCFFVVHVCAGRVRLPRTASNKTACHVRRAPPRPSQASPRVRHAGMGLSRAPPRRRRAQRAPRANISPTTCKASARGVPKARSLPQIARRDARTARRARIPAAGGRVRVRRASAVPFRPTRGKRAAASASLAHTLPVIQAASARGGRRQAGYRVACIRFAFCCISSKWHRIASYSVASHFTSSSPLISPHLSSSLLLSPPLSSSSHLLSSHLTASARLDCRRVPRRAKTVPGGRSNPRTASPFVPRARPAGSPRYVRTCILRTRARKEKEKNGEQSFGMKRHKGSTMKAGRVPGWPAVIL